MSFSRPSGRMPDAMRGVSIIRNVSKHAEGSCLVKFGDTHVLCTASLEERVPPWLRGKGQGWVTAEYGMLPRATNTRNDRKRTISNGRTQEIQRLIGRSLRAVTDMDGFGERQVRIDCDVLQADGELRNLLSEEEEPSRFRCGPSGPGDPAGRRRVLARASAPRGSPRAHIVSQSVAESFML